MFSREELAGANVEFSRRAARKPMIARYRRMPHGRLQFLVRTLHWALSLIDFPLASFLDDVERKCFLAVVSQCDLANFSVTNERVAEFIKLIITEKFLHVRLSLFQVPPPVPLDFVVPDSSCVSIFEFSDIGSIDSREYRNDRRGLRRRLEYLRMNDQARQHEREKSTTKRHYPHETYSLAER